MGLKSPNAGVWAAPEEPVEIIDLRGRPALRYAVTRDGVVHHFRDTHEQAAMCAAAITMNQED